MTGANSGAGTTYPSGEPEFTASFQWGSCCSIFSFLCCALWMILCSFGLFSVAIVCSVLVRFTATDYPFGMFALVLNNIITFHCSVSYLGQCANCFSLTITVREHRKRNQELTIQRHRQHRTQGTERRHTKSMQWGKPRCSQRVSSGANPGAHKE